jgi:predicted double-glycine peptidase
MNASPHFLPACLALGALEISAPVRFDEARLIKPSTAPDCGPATLATLLQFYLGVPTTEAEIAGYASAKPEAATSLRGLELAARAKGCGAGTLRASFATLEEQLNARPTPLIVRWVWPNVHFALVFSAGKQMAVADPCVGTFLAVAPRVF